MQQQVTLQINTKTIAKLMVGMMVAVPAAILLTLAVLIPSIAKADTTQTANANPTINIPAGYSLVPAGSVGKCSDGEVAPSAEGEGTVSEATTQQAISSFLPGSYSSTINQTHNDYVYRDSFNTRSFALTVGNVDVAVGSNNPITSTNTSTSTVSETTTSTVNTTSNSNVGNTNNSVNNSNNSETSNNGDDVIVRVVESLNNNTVTIPTP